jgi:hypothetical protein
MPRESRLSSPPVNSALVKIEEVQDTDSMLALMDPSKVPVSTVSRPSRTSRKKRGNTSKSIKQVKDNNYINLVAENVDNMHK